MVGQKIWAKLERKINGNTMQEINDNANKAIGMISIKRLLLRLIRMKIKKAQYKAAMINGKYPKGPLSKPFSSLIAKTIPVGIETISKMASTPAGMKTSGFIRLTTVKITWANNIGAALYLIAIKTVLKIR